MEKVPFVDNLGRSLDYLRGFSVSFVVQSLIADGTLEMMKRSFTVDDVSARQTYRPDLFAAVVKFLIVEEIVETDAAPNSYRLTSFGRWIAEQPGWFNLLVGGYQNVFARLADILREGSQAAERSSRWVGLGSYQISLHDAFPLAWQLFPEVNSKARRFVDIGCGDGYFVREICTRLPQATAIGVEPSQSYENAVRAVERSGLSDRIEIVNTDGLTFDVPPDTDFLIFAFVLQEMLPQVGEEGLIAYFRKLRQSGFTGAVLAIEVEHDADNLSLLRTPVGRGYYNPYYLLHPLTNQRLMPIGWWKELFAEAGYRLSAERVVDPHVDPTGLEVGLVFTVA